MRRQIDDIHVMCPEATIYYETYTGTKQDRPEWQKLLRLCRSGQVSEIWFCDVSRMSRNKEEGYETWKELYDLGVDLHFITAPHVDTTTYKEALDKVIHINTDTGDKDTNELVGGILSSVNDYMIKLAKKQIYIAFEEAEQEAENLSQRTKEGLVIAKIKGKQVSREEGITIDTWKRRKAVRKIKSYYLKYGGPVTATDCMKLCEISKSTFYRYIQQIDDEIEGNVINFTYKGRHSKKAVTKQY